MACSVLRFFIGGGSRLFFGLGCANILAVARSQQSLVRRSIRFVKTLVVKSHGGEGHRQKFGTKLQVVLAIAGAWQQVPAMTGLQIQAPRPCTSPRAKYADGHTIYSMLRGAQLETTFT